MTKVLRAQQECLKVKIPAEQPFGRGAGELKVLLRSSPMQNSQREREEGSCNDEKSYQN